MANVVMYTSAYCPYCANAERLLLNKGVKEIHKIRIDVEPEKRSEMMEKPAGALCRKFTLMINTLVGSMTCVHLIWQVAWTPCWPDSPLNLQPQSKSAKILGDF